MRKFIKVAAIIVTLLLTSCVQSVYREAVCEGAINQIPMSIKYHGINNKITKSIHTVTYDFDQENEVGRFLDYLDTYSAELNSSPGIDLNLRVEDKSVILVYQIDYRFVEKDTLIKLGLMDHDCINCETADFSHTILIREEEDFICQFLTIEAN